MALPLAAGACSSSSGPPSLDQACSDYILVARQRATKCYGVAPEPDRARAMARETRSCVVYSEAPGSNVNAAFWASCAQQANDACQGYSCPYPAGSRRDGEPCLIDAQCASLWCKGTGIVGASGAPLTDTAQCGSCAEKRPAGAPCDIVTDLCQSGSSCFDGVCRTTGRQGDPCVQWSDCASPWICRSDRFCGPILGLGQPCEASTDCATDEGCDAVTKLCVPIVFAPPLAACDGDVNRCEVGVCELEPGAATGICPRVLSDGAHCDPGDRSAVCDVDATCFNDVCQIVDPSTCAAAAQSPDRAGADAGVETFSDADAADATEAPVSDAASDSQSVGAEAAIPALTCDSGEPVPVCVEYFQVESTCLGQDLLSAACQAGLIPDGAAELSQIEMLCAVNLQRAQQACR